MSLKELLKDLELKPQDKLNRVLFLIQQKIKEVEKQLIQQTNLPISHRELIYVVYIKDCSGMNMMDICKIMGLSKGAFSKAIKILLTKNIVKKVKSKEDARISTLVLTELGEKAIAVYQEARDIINEKIINKIFDKNEVESLNNIADKFLHNI